MKNRYEVHIKRSDRHGITDRISVMADSAAEARQEALKRSSAYKSSDIVQVIKK